MALRARDRSPWLLILLLTALLVVLGLLQYRWTQEIGRAAAERRQAELQRTARRFAFSLGRELGQLAIAFFPDAGPPVDRRAFLLDRLEDWQQRASAGLVSGVLLATRGRRGPQLEEALPGDDAFREASWPEDLRPLHDLLEGDGRAASPGLPFRPGALLARPLGVVLPLFGARQETGPAGRRRLAVDGMVLVRLSEDYLRERLLPRLAEAQLGQASPRPFVLAVLRLADRSVLYASEPDAVSSRSRADDLELELPGRRGATPGPTPGDAGAPAGGERPPDEESPWLLVARHRGGSFDETVASVQRRNLATGFGVLALLGATTLLLVVSAQRARRLARQQVDFVTGVTHELNTPLAAIRSAGQNLSAGIVTDPGQVRRYGDLIEKEGSRLTGLVAQVLDFAGIESGARAYAREPLSLVALVDDVLRDHRLALEQSGIEVERSLPQDLPELRGDAPALRRAIANLVANAVKFAAAGRWIGVFARPRPDGGAVLLRVEDRGPGIPREERERVFEPFYRGPATSRNDAPGSGLGLSVVRHVARAHGGSVRVEARDGGGAAVVLELPVPAGGGA